MWSHYDVPSSTCDLSNAPILELQRMVARPYRFQRAIIKQNLARRSPTKLQPPYARTTWIKDDCSEAILIPGGRWLVVLSQGYDLEGTVSSLAVHEIRMPAEKNFAMVAHHVLRWEKGRYSSIAVAPDHMGLGPMIFVQILHANPIRKFSLIAYRLRSLQPATHALERVASVDMLDLPISIGPLRATGSLLAHIYTGRNRHKLFVWDWVNGRYGVYRGDDNSIAVSAFIYVPSCNFLSPFTLENPILVTIENDGALLLNEGRPDKMIKLSWPDSPIEEHLKPTSGPLVVNTPAVSIEDEFLMPNLQDTWLHPYIRHLVIPSKDWSTATQRPSLLIPDLSHGRAFLITIVPNALSFVTQTFPLSTLSYSSQSTFHGKTISGHMIVCDNTGGVTTLLSGGGCTHQVLEKDINRRDTPTQVPFMCPVSGTFGYMGRQGQIFVWQQK
ncbi:hypothetical protein FRB93_006786 [Tulasnella sp. JGI-2019a]|nr:hypothetical protein FRB93_006786 [Tulasnella sp. JGI-2019a]